MELQAVTVIVPTRNEAHNIVAFLQSLPPEVPLIVVDAGDDETPELIRQNRPHQTQVISSPAKIAEARQIGAEAANTPWLLFTDADIIFAPDYFDRLRTHKHTFDSLYGPKMSLDQHIDYYRWFSRGQQLLHNLGIPAVSGSNHLVSRQVFMDIGGYDLNLTVNEDSEIGWRIKRRSYRIDFAPNLVVYARDHRRLKWGATRKTWHSLLRCMLLYLNLMPDRWRSHDWGYWATYRD
jgi:glycosyltransferase involved in cell wall biosynthesis